MLLGGTIVGTYSGVTEWEKLLKRSRFKAITAPFSCRTPKEEVHEYCEAIRRFYERRAAYMIGQYGY